MSKSINAKGKLSHNGTDKSKVENRKKTWKNG